MRAIVSERLQKQAAVVGAGRIAGTNNYGEILRKVGNGFDG